MYRTALATAVLMLSTTSASASAPPTERQLRERLTAVEAAIDASSSPQAKACEAYVGQTVTPTPFDLIAAKFTGLAAKGEYETTAAFEARRSAAVNTAGTRSYILHVPVDRSFLNYNADADALVLSSLAFGAPSLSGNTGSDMFGSVFLGDAGLETHVALPNLALPISTTDAVLGSYTNMRCG